ncbi:MAG TPA: hypothetical protein VMR86_07205 [Myxococcota bacterium]|nr:hypothetical protein [Myxococcota bacterium]
MSVRIGCVLGVITALLCAGAASAATISTGMVRWSKVFPTETSGAVECSVSNVTTKPVMVTSVEFIDENGEVFAGSPENGCAFPNPIVGGLACIELPSNFGSGKFMRCQVVTKGSAKSLRVQIRSMGISDNGAAVETSSGQ